MAIIRWRFENVTRQKSSYAYHTIDEMAEYWSFIKGRKLSEYEIEVIKSRLVFEDDHLWLKDTVYVGMYWWSKNKGVEI